MVNRHYITDVTCLSIAYTVYSITAMIAVCFAPQLPSHYVIVSVIKQKDSTTKSGEQRTTFALFQIKLVFFMRHLT